MSSPILDEAAALERLGGDRELLGVLIEAFAEEKQLALAEIEAACQTRDARRLQIAVHRLKGGAGTLGGMETWELAYRVENLAKAGTWEGTDEAIREMLAALERFQVELDRLGQKG